MSFYLHFRVLSTSNVEAIRYEILKISSTILQVVKLVSKSFGIQLFCIVLVLLLFGVITVFAFINTANLEAFPMIRIVMVLFYIHFILYEIAYYGHSTFHKVG